MSQKRDTLDDFDQSNQVGDWCFVNDDGYIFVRLHAGDDGTCMLPLRTDPANRNGQHPVWQWDGNHDSPTLSPSILHHSTPEWHGYLRVGALVIA